MLTLLVVDDEPFVRISMASLRDWPAAGYDFRFEAGNGRQALELLARHPEIDIVLLDLSMPVMDGIAFLKALPEALSPRSGQGPAVIVLSAHDNFPLVREAFTLGVRDYLLKTEVDERTLTAILDKVAGELSRVPGTMTDREQQEFMTAQLLRDILSEDLSADWNHLSAGLGIELDFPLKVWAIRIFDFDTVAERYDTGELARFNELFLRSVRQILEKRGGGWAVTVAKDLVAVFTGQAVEVLLFAQEVKESLERYLSVRIEVLSSPPIHQLQEIPKTWEDLSRTKSGSSRIVLLTKRYLREHRSQPLITLDELAAHAEVSRNHLSWEFTRETGETITDHLARLRVEDACRLLATTTLKVYEISEKVGYTNVEHFCRVFKRITGFSPNRWAGENGSKLFRDIHQ
jgi:YesN/AraC family two-component response regulator